MEICYRDVKNKIDEAIMRLSDISCIKLSRNEWIRFKQEVSPQDYPGSTEVTYRGVLIMIND